MSGGFFRGTSADQDTRFSNKQAKLLKSQKFPAELDHLVDMSKVKMDVIRPWIATRATELLGFEDEVLINFVYGLLEGKEVDGKQIQIQLTGFMEKNTGKFMKELWGLLLSAQNNASGVPQQFLDAKEEEMKKKKAETDRIAEEIHKRKERGGWESEQEKKNRMDGKLDIPGPTDLSRNANAASDVKHSSRRSMTANLEDEDDVNRRHGSRRKSRSSLSPARSGSKSFSNSRSYSGERSSRSKSISPSHQRRSVSHERRYRSPQRNSISPRHISKSPSRKRLSHPRRRSISRPRHRSPSPVRRGSPRRRRSPSPLRYKSPTFPRRRSPFYQRSPGHGRRFPSPSRRRSPMRRQTPRRRSPSPLRRRSPHPRSPRRYVHSPIRRKIEPQRSPYQQNRSHSPLRSQSPSSPTRRSLSRDLDSHSNGLVPKAQDNYSYQRSPVHRISERDDFRSRLEQKRIDSASRKQLISARSPQRDDPVVLHDSFDKTYSSLARSEKLETSFQEKSVKGNENRVRTSSRSPSRKSRVGKILTNSLETVNRQETTNSREGKHREKRRHPSADLESIQIPKEASDSEGFSPRRLAANQSAEIQKESVYREMRADRKSRDQRHTKNGSHSSDEIEYGPGRLGSENVSPGFIHEGEKSEREASPREERWKDPTLKGRYLSDIKRQSPRHSKDDEHDSHLLPGMRTNSKEDRHNKDSPIDSDSEDDARYKKRTVEKRVRKPDHGKEAVHDETGYDSPVGDKEDKRRRKDEKRLRKEEKRRKREERHRKKEERRAEKKAKHLDAGTPPLDSGKSRNAADVSDGDVRTRTDVHPSDTDEDEESQQKRLEIQLREKALQSLRAKKTTTH